MVNGVGLGWEVGQVVRSRLPVNDEVTLFNSILYPVEAHVDCFAPSDFGDAFSDAACRLIVIREGGGSLRVTGQLQHLERS